jgi:hypothetical protein
MKTARAALDRVSAVKYFAYGFAFGGGTTHPLLLLLTSAAIDKDSAYVVANTDCAVWFARYTAAYYGVLKHSNGNELSLESNAGHAVRIAHLFEAEWGMPHFWAFLGILTRNLAKYGVLVKVMGFLPESVVAWLTVAEKIVKEEPTGATPPADTNLQSGETPSAGAAAEEAVRPKAVSETPVVSDVLQKTLIVLSAFETRLESLEKAVVAWAREADDSSPESPPGSAARSTNKKTTVYDRGVTQSSTQTMTGPEGFHGDPALPLPIPNFAVFFKESTCQNQTGNGVFVQGKLLTLGHVAELSSHVRVGSEVFVLEDLKKVSERRVEKHADSVVCWALKTAGGARKIRLAPDSAEVGDAVFGQPILNGFGAYTQGRVRTRSSTNESGEFTYTVSTTTQAGCSGAPFFVSEGGSVLLLGLHYGTNPQGNVIIGLLPADFQS